MRAARHVKATLGVGVALLAAVVAVTLTHAPPRVLRHGVAPESLFTRIDGDGEICQDNEVLAAGVTALRLALPAFFGTRVRLTAYSGSRVLTSGTHNADWTGSSVTVPVTPLRSAATHVRLCLTIGPNSEPIDIGGQKTPRREMAVWRDGEPIGGRLSLEDLGPGKGSWWSRILTVARHMGIGHALTGTWVTLLIAALMAAVGLLAIRLAIRELP